MKLLKNKIKLFNTNPIIDNPNIQIIIKVISLFFIELSNVFK